MFHVDLLSISVFDDVYVRLFISRSSSNSFTRFQNKLIEQNKVNPYIIHKNEIYVTNLRVHKGKRCHHRQCYRWRKTHAGYMNEVKH